MLFWSIQIISMLDSGADTWLVRNFTIESWGKKKKSRQFFAHMKKKKFPFSSTLLTVLCIVIETFNKIRKHVNSLLELVFWNIFYMENDTEYYIETVYVKYSVHHPPEYTHTHIVQKCTSVFVQSRKILISSKKNFIRHCTGTA